MVVDQVNNNSKSQLSGSYSPNMYDRIKLQKPASKSTGCEKSQISKKAQSVKISDETINNFAIRKCGILVTKIDMSKHLKSMKLQVKLKNSRGRPSRNENKVETLAFLKPNPKTIKDFQKNEKILADFSKDHSDDMFDYDKAPNYVSQMSLLENSFSDQDSTPGTSPSTPGNAATEVHPTMVRNQTVETSESLEDKGDLETMEKDCEGGSYENLFGGVPPRSCKKRSTYKFNETLEYLKERDKVISKENVKIGLKNQMGENDGSDNESIVVEIQDSPVLRKSSRKRQGSVNKDSIKLCEYPVGKSDTVTVAIQDYVTLEDDTFLNDIIIDFYLTHLKHNILPSEDRGRVHIFSTMFYKALLRLPKKNAKKVASFETDPALSTPEKRHRRVAGWTKRMDLFTKDLLIFPICENSHWYLLLVVKPGLISLPVDSEERQLKGEPFVIVLDSLGRSNDRAVINIWLYLACEWEKKYGGNEEADAFNFYAGPFKSACPMKPHQQNGSDCGIYLLHYVEKIFSSVANFLQPSLPDLTNWFTEEEVGLKRGEIAQLIKSLSSEQNPGKIIKIPNINFSPSNPNKSKENSKLMEEADEMSSEAVVEPQNDLSEEVDENVFVSLKSNGGSDSESAMLPDSSSTVSQNQTNLMLKKVVGQTIQQLSPNVRDSRGVNDVPTKTHLYINDDNESEDSISSESDDNHDDIEARNSHKLIKRVKLSHFQDTESESVKMFNKFLFEGISSGDSDIFSQDENI